MSLQIKKVFFNKFSTRKKIKDKKMYNECGNEKTNECEERQRKGKKYTIHI